MFVSQLASCLWRNLGLHRSSENNIDPAKYDRRTHRSWCSHAKHIRCEDHNNEQDAAAIRILEKLVTALDIQSTMIMTTYLFLIQKIAEYMMTGIK